MDRAWLKGEVTIGCNMEYKMHPTIAMVQDLRLLKGDGGADAVVLANDPEWHSTPGTQAVYFHGHPDQQLPEGVPDSVALARSDHSREKPFQWGTSLETGLFYGANVGMAAINLAEILGADSIFLLGFDANKGDPRTHHHRSYPKDWLGDQESRAVVYETWKRTFRSIAKWCKVPVYNLNPMSGIDAFPKVLLGMGGEPVPIKG